MTCPSANLRSAVLSSDHDDRASFLSPSTSSGGKPTSPAKPASNGLSSAAVAGIVLGVLAIVVLIVGLALWRRREWPFKSAKPHNTDTSSTRSAKDGLMDNLETPWTTHMNSSSVNTLSSLSDPRSTVSQYKSGGHNSPSLHEWRMQHHTPPPPPFFQPHPNNSRLWPSHNPYDTDASPPRSLPDQNTWQVPQPVHELLAEVQKTKTEQTELATEERVQELRASCVIQPLRPPPSLKGPSSPGVPDSPTLGPVFNANGANRKASAAEEVRPSDGTPMGGYSVVAPTPRQVGIGFEKKKQPDPSFDSTNII
ncbi:hypothetical protein DHEL01_v210473 [Diaporthe helianthi]|uniref:Uncharacterized protein n=1 Tax=Diaporthe helianthi TaxID=158607 RepID=A0A2P5HLK1_DIAHE|nr:hypothetical protein DHEL01_v210473 [Diaporthe helianthi]